MTHDTTASFRTGRDHDPRAFWCVIDPHVRPEDWTEAMRASMACLAGLPAAERDAGPEGVIPEILSEAQFGPGHWRLNRRKRLYYQLVRPILPDSLREPLRTALLSRQTKGFSLGWPIEDRYARFQFEIVARLMAAKGLGEASHVRFWPGGKRFALVLTHDVETADGYAFVREIAALEERYGFRSSFNFVPEAYCVETGLRNELERRGFEVGVHGLRHDGKKFSSRAAFEARARRINAYAKEWGAVGFRSPMTHRHPEWMQALEVEYDLSFFDTDPYEPIPGGTMSIWPFIMGRFVELPYTLAQDHTLMVTLGKRTPRLWLEKIEFVARYEGLALLNAHPDYLREPALRAVYEEFLKKLAGRGDCWYALPRETARWWRARAACGESGAAAPPSGSGFVFTIGTIRLNGEGRIVIS
jgi:peptidoglycan/xylan/chitin deacetylase (PgdA/CDA1 family)